MMEITCFKAYDVRGRVPEELNPRVAYQIGRGFAEFVQPKRVALGHDIRHSSPELVAALVQGLNAAGVEVMDIGIGGTELVYFATAHYELDGGIMVTASHNPPNYNGLKMVREEARPLSADTGLKEIKRLAEAVTPAGQEDEGLRATTPLDIWPAYLEHLLSYVEPAAFRDMKIVVNAGNGGAGAVIDRLERHLPAEFVKLNHEPDGSFPNGVPNPMLIDNRTPTAAAVRDSGAQLGVAWDGDYDRCFFFDEAGDFVEGYYIVGLLAASFLSKFPGERIVHDPRVMWNTLDIVTEGGGTPVLSKSGHAFIKATMREHDAIYGGEMSAHHYFRNFAYADSGMIPWLLIGELMQQRREPLSALVAERIARFPSSGEINRKVEDAAATLAEAEDRYGPSAISVDHTDGVSVDFEDWRFNLRASNTEPLIRLNVEARGDAALMRARTDELLELIGGQPG